MTIKMTHHIRALCDEMYERRSRYGMNWPGNQREKSLQKLRDAGYVHETSPGWYYFTEEGLTWYLSQYNS